MVIAASHAHSFKARNVKATIRVNNPNTVKITPEDRLSKRGKGINRHPQAVSLNAQPCLISW
jgi:hypothetical protein